MKTACLGIGLAGLLLALPRSSQAGDENRRTLEAAKLAIKDARTMEEKAVQIQALGTLDPGDPGVVPELARFLYPNPADINFLLATTAAATLGRLRGSRPAALVLLQALPAYRKTPYLQRKLIAALGQVGHDAGLPTLEELLTGPDPDAGLAALKALCALPPDLALDSLFRQWTWMQKRRPKVGDDVKKLYDRLGLDLLKAVQDLSGQKYPSMAELEVWWTRHASAFKEEAAARERDRARRDPASPPPELPPLLLVELLFGEKGGTSTANLGSSSGTFPGAALTKNRPVWTPEAPPSGAPSSLDWGFEPGPLPIAVDLPGPLDHLKNLKSFTVTGWINARSAVEGPGGNRLVSWLERDGVELVHRSDGSLQVGINQKAELSELRTPSQSIPVVDPAQDHPFLLTWRFFAVTFDATAAHNQVKIYLGTRDLDAALSIQRDCPVEKTGPRVAGGLSIGNLPALQRAGAPKCNFRGLMHEIRIFGSTWDGSGALALPALLKVQGRP